MRWAIVMAGGQGTRFWPLSRRHLPKHVLHFLAGRTLFQETLARLPRWLPPERTVVVTTPGQTAVLRRQAGRRLAKVLVEPVGRNTAAAVAYAALWIARRDPKATVVALPADQAVRRPAAFRKALGRVCDVVEKTACHGTLAIKPDRPDTGFGYLERGSLAAPKSRSVPVFWLKRFVEKPTLGRARAFLSSGRFYWNSGVFIWRLPRLLAALRRKLPRVFLPLQAALSRGTRAALERAYAKVPRVSIDKGLMERERDIVSAHGDFGWSDLGTWESLAVFWTKDARGNRASGEVVAIDASRNILHSTPGGLVAVLGVSDLIVVRTDKAVLVIPRSETQRVREVVAELARRSGARFL